MQAPDENCHEYIQFWTLSPFLKDFNEKTETDLSSCFINVRSLSEISPFLLDLRQNTVPEAGIY
jgi:hypothetical protein